MVETHKRKRKNTVITKVTLTISNGEHIICNRKCIKMICAFVKWQLVNFMDTIIIIMKSYTKYTNEKYVKNKKENITIIIIIIQS